MDKRFVAQALLVVAVFCALAGWGVYEKIGGDAEADQQVENIRAAIDGDPFADDVEADYTPAYLLWGAAAVAAVCCAVFWSQTDPAPEPEPEPVDPDVTPT